MHERSVVREKSGIEHDLPEMAIRIGEVPGVAAPERLSRRLHDGPASLLRLLHDGIDFLLASNVVTDRELGAAARRLRQSGIVCETLPRPDRELETLLQVEEGDGTVLELAPDDALG